MHIINRNILMILLLLLASDVFAGDAREVMKRVQDRDDATVEISRTKLSTCRISKKDKKIACVKKPRVKVFEGVRKDYGPQEKDSKSVMIILDPPGVRGIGFLQYDYDKRDTDQWIYFSALGKVKKIVSASENEPNKGSFFGTEISYEDVEQKKLDEYVYKIIKSETYQGRECWVIESLPTQQRARKSNYSKSLSWVDKERFLVLKTVLFNRQGRKAKRITMRNIEQIDGIWSARKIYFNNLLTKRMTTLSLEAVAYNIPVKDEIFTQRTLTDSAFREQNLEKLRLFLK